MRFTFAGLTLDEARRQLLRNGREVPLSPKAYELLRMLIAGRPKAFSKAEIHDALWPGTFVSEATLASLVSDLRTALGERGRHGPFVRTVHGFGYAFEFGGVEVADDEPARHRPVAAAPNTACWLVWGGSDHALRPGSQVVGRGHDADVQVDAGTVSRLHARVVWDGGHAWIEDLASKNGTWVNGTRVAGTVPLADGDELRLGSITMVFRLRSPECSTLTATPR